MKQINFELVIRELAEHGIKFGSPIRICVPDAKAALQQAMSHFIGPQLVWLPEYDEVAMWLKDNHERGLCIYGTNGTGKTVLVRQAIPALLLTFCGKPVRCFSYYELNANADKLLQMRIPALDDVGLENEMNDFGNRRLVFPELMDIAEKRRNIVIFNTNLNGKGLCERYGIRTFERIVATTKRIELIHKSFRI